MHKDLHTSFILLKDENNPYRTEDPLNEFYREDLIYLDNFHQSDNEAQNFKFVYSYVKNTIKPDYSEYHEDIATIITKINISKIISGSIIKPHT